MVTPGWLPGRPRTGGCRGFLAGIYAREDRALIQTIKRGGCNAPEKGCSGRKLLRPPLGPDQLDVRQSELCLQCRWCWRSKAAGAQSGGERDSVFAKSPRATQGSLRARVARGRASAGQRSRSSSSAARCVNPRLEDLACEGASTSSCVCVSRASTAQLPIGDDLIKTSDAEGGIHCPVLAREQGA
jgi:hypothetical protein